MDTTHWQLYQDPEGFIRVRHPAEWVLANTRIGASQPTPSKQQPHHRQHNRQGHTSAGTPESTRSAPHEKVKFTYSPAIDLVMGPDPLDPINGLVVYIRCMHAPKPWNFSHPLPAPNTILAGTPAYHNDVDDDVDWVLETPQAHYELRYAIPGKRLKRLHYVSLPFGVSVAPFPQQGTLDEWRALATAVIATFTPGPSAG